MNNKRFVLGTIAVLLASILVLGTGGAVSAQGPIPPVYGMGPGGMMGGFGGFTGLAGPQNSLISIAAQALNMNVTDLIAELQKGKSIAEVLKAKGVSTDKVVSDSIAAHTTLLKSLVDAGRLTQAQADAQLALVKTNEAAHLDYKWTAGAFGYGLTNPVFGTRPMLGGRGFGARGGFWR